MSRHGEQAEAAVSNVVSFPKSDERAWREYEPALWDFMLGVGISTEVAEWVLADLKPRFLATCKETTLDLNIKAECKPAVDATIEQMTKFMREASVACLMEMIKLEILLYDARQPSPS